MTASHPQQLRSDLLVSSLTGSIQNRVAELAASGISPRLAVVVASDDPAVTSYADSKRRKAKQLGVEVTLVTLHDTSSQAAFERAIIDLAKDPATHGIMIELPVAKGLDASKALELIPANKDVDGLTAANLGLLAQGHEDQAICPATPRSCILLAEQMAEVVGATVAVVGRGATVGKPLSTMLLNRHATVTVCHSKTPDVGAAIAASDFVFTAVGKPHFLNQAMLQPHHRVIDAGISYIDGKLAGDFDPAAANFVRAYTPVPGGVGPLTSILIFDNLLRCIAIQGHA